MVVRKGSGTRVRTVKAKPKKRSVPRDLPTLLDAIATADQVQLVAAQAEADAYGALADARTAHGDARYASVQAQQAYAQAVADLVAFLSQ